MNSSRRNSKRGSSWNGKVDSAPLAYRLVENADSFTLLRNPVQGKEKREMGNLLSFVRSLGDKSVSEIDDKFKLFIDFEKDKIENEGEQKVHDLSVKVDGKIGESSEALKFLANYGPGTYILLG